MNYKVLFWLFSGLFTLGCQTTSWHPLTGTWEVVDLRADFDERRVNPETFGQFMAYLQQTRLSFRADSTALIQRLDKTDTLQWRLYPSENVIRLHGGHARFQSLLLRGERIEATEQTSIGAVSFVFERVKE